MKRLNEKEIEFVEVRCAKSQGEKPYVLFEILDFDAVNRFLKDTEGSKIWSNTLNGARLESTIMDAVDVAGRTYKALCVARMVKKTTFPEPANETLAEGILHLVLDADKATAGDILKGLTHGAPSFSEATASFNANIRAIADELYTGAAASSTMSCHK